MLCFHTIIRVAQVGWVGLTSRFSRGQQMATQIDKATRSDAAEPLASVPLWINGQRVASRSARSGKVTNASTGRVVRTVPFANAEDVDAAVKAAAAAFPEWRATPPLRRARIL